MKRKQIFRWLALVSTLALALWCLFPMHYSRVYTQAFRSVDAANRQRLVELLLVDYAQTEQQDTDGRICYFVAYDDHTENRTATSIQRLWKDRTTGKLMKAELPHRRT